MTVFGRTSSAVAVIVLLAAGCSSDEAESQADQSASSSTTSVLSTFSSVEAADVEETAPTTTIPALESDFGVDETSIRVGLSVDLSGPLSGIDSFVVDAHLAYFDEVNAAGGIAGRMVDILSEAGFPSDPV